MAPPRSRRSNADACHPPPSATTHEASAALSEAQLAVRWEISTATLQRWRKQTIGPAFCKIGGRVRYLRKEVEAYEQRRRRYGTNAPAPAAAGASA